MTPSDISAATPDKINSWSVVPHSGEVHLSQFDASVTVTSVHPFDCGMFNKAMTSNH